MEKSSSLGSLAKNIYREVKEKRSLFHPSGVDCYSFRRILNTGSVGKVKFAINNVSGESVAIKVIRSVKRKNEKGEFYTRKLMTRKQRVANEAKCLSMCRDHPNVVTIKDCLSTPRKLYIVTEVADGGDLFDRVAKSGAYPEDRALNLFAQLMSAMALMHTKGIAHLDVKPENLLLKSPNHILLCDFGMATNWSPADGTIGNVAGTVRCLAPEQIKRQGKTEFGYLPFPADIYSCGIVLFFLLTGNFPFEGSTEDQDTLSNTILASFQWDLPQDTSPQVKSLVMSMLAFDPQDRPTANEVVDRLGEMGVKFSE